MPSRRIPRGHPLLALLNVVRTLRHRCPWDRKQRLASTRPLILNETFELDDALRKGDAAEIAEELGDYIFMGLFLADVLEAEHGVGLGVVVNGIVRKLKARHPHIYGNVKVRNAAEVLTNWERIKRGEKKGDRSILASVPSAMPALQQAQLIQERCRRVGFDWDDPRQVLDKVVEEVEELRVELARPRRRGRRVREELGDLLFALVNLSRHLGIDSEGTLKDANDKFRRRFGAIESHFVRAGRDLGEVPLAEMEQVWQQAKNRRSAGRTRRATRHRD
jgi:MazG family protein